jgi:hypothetical protein
MSIAIGVWPSTASTVAAGAPQIQLRLAVLLVNFAKQPSQPWTKAAAEDLYFGASNSVAAYYDELSNGRISVTGSVFGYLTIGSRNDYCLRKTWASAARSRATAAGIDLNEFTNIAYVFPYQKSCWWTGFANGPKSGALGRDMWLNGLMNLYVATHELAHNLGAGHAGSLICNSDGLRTAISGACRAWAYGDPFDVMGYDGHRHMSAWMRSRIGALPAEDVATVTESGTYRISPAALAGTSDPRMLLIRRRNGGQYALEYRQPFGAFDDFADGSPAVNGISVRVVPASVTVNTRLVDTRPETCTFNDAPLAEGRTLADAGNNISITTVSVGGGHAEVEIDTSYHGPPSGPATLPDASGDTTPPSEPSGLTSSPVTGRQVRILWKAADDDIGVKHYEVALNGTIVGSTCDLMLGDLDVKDGKSYQVSVTAVDFAGNASTPAITTIAIPDVSSPARPRRPKASASQGNVTIRWTGTTDNVGVTIYRLIRNGVPIADLGPSERSFVDSGLARDTTYTYQVVAIDEARYASASLKSSVRVP